MKSKYTYSFFSSCILLLTFIMIIGCSSASSLNQDSSKLKDGVADTISIQFTPLPRQELVLEKLNHTQIDEVVIEYHTDEGVFFIFSKREHADQADQTDQYYAGFNNGLEMFEFWEMGYALENLHIEPVEVFGKTLIKMVGICGAACPINLYVYTEEQAPKLLLASNWHTIEVDLDEDGMNEIAASSGTQPDSKIFIKENDIIVESESLKDSLGGANSVVYSADLAAFWASYDDQVQRYFVYVDKELVPLKESKSIIE